MSEEYFELLKRALEAMKLINGPDEKCVHGENWDGCRNHKLIHDIEDYLCETPPTKGEAEK